MLDPFFYICSRCKRHGSNYVEKCRKQGCLPDVKVRIRPHLHLTCQACDRELVFLPKQFPFVIREGR